eukprot:5560401-Amphidinium_carterae.1
MGEAVWSTASAEKQHSDLAPDVLCARSYMHLARQLLPAETAAMRDRRPWEAHMERMSRQITNKVTSSNKVFVRKLMKIAARWWNGLATSRRDKYER